ncbi:MAG: branched-chain amino acid ABC transporter permease [Deltaproteobacteria bacterium]|nr:branched-chain amino acid ABC transporter permease [Deltaproteobacteria bacterium]
MKRVRTPTRLSVALLSAGFLLFLGWPWLTARGGIHCQAMSMALFHGCLALAWNICSMMGAVSLGHTAFFGLGAYGSALLCHYGHLNPFLTIPLGGILGAFYGVLWHIAFGKLRGAPFALASLASVEIPKVIIDNWESFTFGSLGVVGIPPLSPIRVGSFMLDFGENPVHLYHLFLVGTLFLCLLYRQALRSRWGWAVRTIREDETAAASLGVNVRRTRLQVFICSAFLTGICGGVYAHLMGLVEPALVFSLHISALPLVLSIFGGRFQWYGPLLGAVVLYPLDQVVFRSLFPVGHSALYGFVVILTLMLFPQGMGAWLQKRLHLASS